MACALPMKHSSKGSCRSFGCSTRWWHEYPNLPAYLIFDAQYLKKYSFANRPVGGEVPKTVSRAGNLPELAAQLGIDGAKLEKTVRRFNGFVERGTDDDFHRGER